jgi:poly(hydroxyalkanoate) depolymerase family esterase
MNRPQRLVLAISIFLALLAAPSAHAASLTMVNRTTWTGGANVPSYVQMYIYVPDKLAAKPPILSAHHSCATTDAMYYFGNLPKIKAAADKNGFIIIVPLAMGRNCWDVGSAASLKHDGGGDTQAIAQMVKYALAKYNGDASRVYAMGGSSGAMMTQALMAVYPDLFKAGSARAGVPAGCWADGYDSSMQWSNNCAAGNTKKTPQQWGDGVRAMYPGYSGHRPRLQIFHGTSDATINYNNFGESIDEWTNVLGLNMTPTSTEASVKGSAATWSRQIWKNGCGYGVFEAWSASGAGHSMTYEEDAIIAFLGLDKTDGDPEADCSGGSDGGVGGTGGPGAGGAGGTGTGTGGSTGKGGGSGSTGGTGVAGGPGGSSSSGAAGAAGSSSTGVAGSSSTGVAGSSSTGAAGSASTGTAGSSSTGVAGSASTGAAGSPSTGAAGSSGAAGGGGSHEDSPTGGLCDAGAGRYGLGALSLLVAAVLSVTRRRRR